MTIGGLGLTTPTTEVMELHRKMNSAVWISTTGDVSLGSLVVICNVAEPVPKYVADLLCYTVSSSTRQRLCTLL